MFVNRLTLGKAARAIAVIAVAWLGPSGAPAACAHETLTAPGARLQSLAGIRSAAEKGARSVIDPALGGVTIEAVSLDARLRLAACADPLDTFATAPRGSQHRITVRVTCGAPAWTLNVPVEIRRTQTVLVLKRAVGRGESLTAADVVAQTRELPGLASPFVASAEHLAGRLTRRPIPEGTALTADALGAALLIHRGQTVTLVAQSAGFEVRAPGRAMSDASARQRVRVQNLNSLKIIEGVADNEGTVRVLP
jgi:flagella basal body P-ring formation protein FlgA